MSRAAKYVALGAAAGVGVSVFLSMTNRSGPVTTANPADTHNPSFFDRVRASIHLHNPLIYAGAAVGYFLAGR